MVGTIELYVYFLIPETVYNECILDKFEEHMAHCIQKLSLGFKDNSE